jgi:hypothetical protein
MIAYTEVRRLTENIGDMKAILITSGESLISVDVGRWTF